MARKPRIHYPGAVYHVMLRGNGGAPIFFEEGDYLYFEELLQEGDPPLPSSSAWVLLDAQSCPSRH